MKTSGIVALAIVVASMEVADAKCYIGHISGFWQGPRPNNKVLAGQVFIPTMNAKKIMIRGFRHALQGADLGVFYAGLNTDGVAAGLVHVQNAGGGKVGNDGQFVYLKYDTSSDIIDADVKDDVSFDLSRVPTVAGATGFDGATDNASKLKWLSVSKHDTGDVHYARFDFAMHFRGGPLTGLLFEASGQFLVSGSAATAVAVDPTTWSIGTGSNGQNVRAYIGRMSWASSRDALDKLTTPADVNELQIRYLPAAGTTNNPISAGNTIVASIDISVPADVATVTDFKWLALHDTQTDGSGGIVGYVY